MFNHYTVVDTVVILQNMETILILHNMNTILLF